MISGDFARDRIAVSVGATALEPDTVTFDIRRGGANFGPYRAGPDVGTATINLYYAPGVSAPTASFVVGATVTFEVLGPGGTLYGFLFTGNLQDFTINYVLDPASGQFGRAVTLYATDLVGYIERVTVPGMVTSATTKNVSWETRWNTLAALVPGSAQTVPTSPESHIFRLVDNNLEAPLTEHLDLACNSVGATWYVNNTNEVQPLKKGSYPTSGILFTDTAGYWTSGNKPANAGAIVYYNIEYSELDAGSDTANLANVVNMTNIMPRNMVTRASGGALVYKDPATTPGPSLPVLEQPYSAEDASSIATYGRRIRDLVTNVYPYRTTDTDSYYLRFNGYNDPGAEYRTTPELFVLGNVCNATTSTSNPKSGTYCWNLTTTALVDGFRVKLGPSGGYPIKTLPTANTNPFIVSFRTSLSTARYTRGIEYYDNNGNILATQLGTLITPTVNTYSTNTTVFMNFATIPAGTVAWRPIINVTHQTAGTNFAIGSVFKFDEITVNPDLDTASYFSGDNADTATDLYSWESDPGESWSYLTRNVLDNIGAEVITYWGAQKNNIRSITFNARQNWETLLYIEPGARVDIRFNGASFTSFISAIRYRCDSEDLLVTLDLSTRPSTWI